MTAPDPGAASSARDEAVRVIVAAIAAAPWASEGEGASSYVRAGVDALIARPDVLAALAAEAGLVVLDVQQPQALMADDLQVEHYDAPPGAGGVPEVLSEQPRGVRLTHTPTGLSAACHSERSQLQNKVAALRDLRAKVRAR